MLVVQIRLLLQIISRDWICTVIPPSHLCNNQAVSSPHEATNADLLRHPRVKPDCGQGSVAAVKSGAMQTATQAPGKSQAPALLIRGLGSFEKSKPQRNNPRDLQSMRIFCQKSPDWNGFSRRTRCRWNPVWPNGTNDSSEQAVEPPLQSTHTDLLSQGQKTLAEVIFLDHLPRSSKACICTVPEKWCPLLKEMPEPSFQKAHSSTWLLTYRLQFPWVHSAPICWRAYWKACKLKESPMKRKSRIIINKGHITKMNIVPIFQQ